MKRKYAEDLAKDYDFETKEDYFNYIVESLVNGQRQQVKNLFNQMKSEDQIEFLNDYLFEDGSYHTSCRKICVVELCK